MVFGEIMPTTKRPIDLPFIISTNRQKADPETRKLIRSHVMRGKNRIKPRRKRYNSSSTNEPREQDSIASDYVRPLNISRLLCSKFSAVGFADDVDPALIEDALLFSSRASKAMFLLNECIAVKTDEAAETWFRSMLLDPAYLCAICFAVQAYFDHLHARTRTLEAQRMDRLLYAKTLSVLRKRFALGDDNLRLSDSTIMTILTLSGHAYTTGDHESADNHNRGLLKLVSMRGTDSFVHNTKLLIEIIRCDLWMALDADSQPVLIASNNSLRSLMKPPTYTTVHCEDVLSNRGRNNVTSVESKLDSKLANVWTDMSEFCARVNAAALEEGAKIAEEEFLHSMMSIMYPLMRQCYRIGSLDEAFRLALLAFSSPIFVHWNRVELPDRQFNSAYRGALAGLDLVEANIISQEYLWLLMVGALSMSHEPDGIAWIMPRICVHAELCSVLDWNSMQNLLNSFLWVGLVFDKSAKDLFDSIMSPTAFGVNISNSGRVCVAERNVSKQSAAS